MPDRDFGRTNIQDSMSGDAMLSFLDHGAIGGKMTQGKSNYEEAWKVLKTWDLILLPMVAGSVPVILVFTVVDLGLPPGIENLLPYALIALFAGTILSLGAVRSMFRCPRCGAFFFLKGTSSNLLSERCVHCQLQRGAPSPMSAR